MAGLYATHPVYEVDARWNELDPVTLQPRWRAVLSAPDVQQCYVRWRRILNFKAALDTADKANEYPRRGVFASPWDTAMDIVDFGPDVPAPTTTEDWRALARASRHPGVCYSGKVRLLEDGGRTDLVSRTFQQVFRVDNVDGPTGLCIRSEQDVKVALVTWMFWFQDKWTLEDNYQTYWQYCQSKVWGPAPGMPLDTQVTPIYPLSWPGPCAMYSASMTFDPPFVDGAVGLYSCCICNQYQHYEQVDLCADCRCFRCKGGCVAFDKLRPATCALCLVVYNAACAAFVSQRTELNVRAVDAAATLAVIGTMFTQPVPLPKPAIVVDFLPVSPPLPPPLPLDDSPVMPVQSLPSPVTVPPPPPPVQRVKPKLKLARRTTSSHIMKSLQARWCFQHQDATFYVIVRKGIVCNEHGFMEPAELYQCVQWNINLRRVQTNAAAKPAVRTLKALPCIAFCADDGTRLNHVTMDVFSSFVQQCLK